jgi:hypothetical protein
VQILPRSKPISISPFAFRALQLRRRVASAWEALPELVRACVIALLLGGWLYVALVVI